MKLLEQRIIDQIRTATEKYDDWQGLNLFEEGEANGIHLAIMAEPFLTYLFEGKKTIESRFSVHCIAPYDHVAVGDAVLLKRGPVVGSFVASSIEYVQLSEHEMSRLQREYSGAICADDDFWQERAEKRYATLIGVEDVRELTPINVTKRDMRGWVVLRDAFDGQLRLS